MEKLINEKGELVLKRDKWMQGIINTTYSQVAIIAVMSGSIEGAQNKAVSDYLKALYKNPLNRHYIDELLEETGRANPLSNDSFDKAAVLIVNSKIPEESKVS